jgi:hypothetical protein
MSVEAPWKESLKVVVVLVHNAPMRVEKSAQCFIENYSSLFLAAAGVVSLKLHEFQATHLI